MEWLVTASTGRMVQACTNVERAALTYRGQCLRAQPFTALFRHLDNEVGRALLHKRGSRGERGYVGCDCGHVRLRHAREASGDLGHRSGGKAMIGTETCTEVA